MPIRRADFSGSWYPAEPADCEREIKRFLSEDNGAALPNDGYLGGIVPHAGWFYSGSIACRVIHALSKGPQPDVVIVFGMHLHENSSTYIMTSGAWETPFGAIEIHETLAQKLAAGFDFKLISAKSHTPDNTIELQLPFVKYFYPRAKLLPIGVPPVSRSLEIGRATVELAAELGVAAQVIGSTDLTHYGRNYGFTSQGSGKTAVEWVKNSNDRRIIDAMLALDPERVIGEARAHKNACCAGAAATTIAAAISLGATRALPPVYTTSYDKTPGDSFVGYVGMVFA
jgi:AmmeMemoRadiSam system protein B